MLLYVHSSIAIILMGKRELIALLNLSSWCLVMVGRLFLAVPRGCLQLVIVVFPDHTHLLFLKPNYNEVSLLISEYNPSVFCFQETFLKPDDNISLKGFNVYNYVYSDCLRPSDGASIFVKSSFPQRLIYKQNYKQLLFLSLLTEKLPYVLYIFLHPFLSTPNTWTIYCSNFFLSISY